MASSKSRSAPTYPAPPITPFPDVQVYPKHSQSENSAPEFDIGDGDSDIEESSDLFDFNDSFTVGEDIFLVRTCCFQPHVPMEEVEIEFRHEFGPSKSVADLDRRLQALQTEQFQPLLALYLKAVCLDRELNGSYGVSATSVKPAFQALLRSLRPSCETRLLQLIYEDEKNHAEPSDMITIEVSSRNFPKYSRLAQKRHLDRCSRVIHELFVGVDNGSKMTMSPNQAFSLHLTSNGTERLQFTDSVPFYDSCPVFNHLEQSILDRFLAFAKDPNVMERLSLQKQQQLEQRRIKRELTRKLHEIFTSQQNNQIERLEEARAIACDSMRIHLERALEEDMLYLRRTHEALLKHEHAKIKAKFDEKIHILRRRIADKKNSVAKLHENGERTSWTNLDQDISKSTLQVERIFGSSDYILRLLILAEDLDADPLRRALVQYLSKDDTLPQFNLRREFSSKMVPESTVLSILKGTSTKDLREIEADSKNFTHHELVTREIHTRKVAFSRFVANLTNDQLRVASRIRSEGFQSVLDADDEESVDSVLLDEMKAVADFSDVLDRELARRRDFSCVKLNSSNLDREVSFSENDCVVQLEVAHRYCSVFATKERKQGESGKWMFEVSIDVFGGEGESLLLGWEVSRSNNLDLIGGVSSLGSEDDSSPAVPFVPGLTPGSDGRSYGVIWQSDGGLEMGMLHANGQSKSGVSCFRAGDVVGCTINQDELVPYLRFYLNGAQVIPPLSATAPPLAGVACQNPVYCLFPVVSMYSSRKKPQTRVRFNFRGDFDFPIPGFEPYGAPM